MEAAKPWYQSKVLMAIVAGLVLNALDKFGVLPAGLTQDRTTDFLLVAVPMILAAVARLKSGGHVLVASAQKAEDVNNGLERSAGTRVQIPFLVGLATLVLALAVMSASGCAPQEPLPPAQSEVRAERLLVDAELLYGSAGAAVLAASRSGLLPPGSSRNAMVRAAKDRADAALALARRAAGTSRAASAAGAALRAAGELLALSPRTGS